MSGTPDELELRIEGVGCLNGTGYEAHGQGRCRPSAGELEFEVDFSEIAPDSDPLAQLLAVLILPTVFGRETGGAHNLLSLADGNFQFTQALSGSGITVESEGAMTRISDKGLLWTARSRGEVRVGTVDAIAPITATMIPQGAGKMLDVLTIPLLRSDKRIDVTTVRQFTFRPSAEMSAWQLRDITVRPRVDGRRVAVAITSKLRLFPRCLPGSG